MMIPYVSVIVPVYNVEEYLAECLDSICNQTLRNIEIICVDDGSQDDSLKILYEYERKDARIKVFSRPNSGPGATRNFALDFAKGEYVLFVDSDDWIDLETIEALYKKSKSQDLDLLIFLVRNYDDDKDIFYEDNYYNHVFVPKELYGTVFNHDDLGDSLLSLATIPFNKLYRRSVLERFHMRFPEGLFFEDNPFHYEALLGSDRISIINKYFSSRRRHNTSITAVNDDKFLDVIEISGLVMEVFRKYNQFDEHIFKVINYKIDYLKRWYNLVDSNLKPEYWKLMHDDLVAISQDSELHGQFLDNLHNANKKFYFNVLNSKSFIEFEHLILKDDFGLFLDKKFKENKSKLDKQTKKLKKLEQKIEKRDKKLKKSEKQLLQNKKEFEEYSSNKEKALDARHAEFNNYVDAKEAYFEDKKKALDARYAEFNKYVDTMEAYFEDKKKALDDRDAEFNKYVDAKETYLEDKNNALDDKSVALEEDFSEKMSYLDLREKELDDLNSDSKLKFFSKFINNKPKISIIMPVYNAEDSIEQCLESIIAQTMSEIEVICVDYGSADNSLKILKDYANRDNKNFKVFNLKTEDINQAKNKGLDKATGEFILFLNPTDILDSDACRHIYDNVKLNELDILLFFAQEDFEINNEFHQNKDIDVDYIYRNFENKTFNCSDLNDVLFDIPFYSNKKVYKRDFLENIRFLEDVILSDIPFHWNVMLSANNISLIENKIIYSDRKQNILKDDYEFLDVILLINSVFEIFNEKGLFSNFSKILIKWKISVLKDKYESSKKFSRNDDWKLLHDEFLRINEYSNGSERFAEDLPENYKKFYADVIKSRSPEELDYLQNY